MEEEDSVETLAAEEEAMTIEMMGDATMVIETTTGVVAIATEEAVDKETSAEEEEATTTTDPSTRGMIGTRKEINTLLMTDPTIVTELDLHHHAVIGAIALLLTVVGTRMMATGDKLLEIITVVMMTLIRETMIIVAIFSRDSTSLPSKDSILLDLLKTLMIVVMSPHLVMTT